MLTPATQLQRHATLCGSDLTQSDVPPAPPTTRAPTPPYTSRNAYHAADSQSHGRTPDAAGKRVNCY